MRLTRSPFVRRYSSNPVTISLAPKVRTVFNVRIFDNRVAVAAYIDRSDFIVFLFAHNPKGPGAEEKAQPRVVQSVLG